MFCISISDYFIVFCFSFLFFSWLQFVLHFGANSPLLTFAHELIYFFKYYITRHFLSMEILLSFLLTLQSFFTVVFALQNSRSFKWLCVFCKLFLFQCLSFVCMHQQYIKYVSCKFACSVSPLLFSYSCIFFSLSFFISSPSVANQPETCQITGYVLLVGSG